MNDAWDLEEEHRVRQVVREHPYQHGMEPMAYIEMIAVLAGLMTAEASVLQKVSRPVQSVRNR